MKLKRHFFESFALLVVATVVVIWKFWPERISNLAPSPAKAIAVRAVKQTVEPPKFRWLAAAETPSPAPDGISTAQSMLNGPSWMSADNAHYLPHPQPKVDITDFGQVEFADGETVVLFLNNGEPIYVTPRLFPDGKIHTIFQQQMAEIKYNGFTVAPDKVTNSITFPGEPAVFDVGEGNDVYITPVVKKAQNHFN